MKKHLKKFSLFALALVASLSFIGCGGDSGGEDLLTNAEKLAVRWTVTSATRQLGNGTPENITSAYSGYSITLNTNDAGDPSNYSQVLPTSTEVSTPDFLSRATTGTWSLSQSNTSVIFTSGTNSSTVNISGGDFSKNEKIASITVNWTDPNINPKGSTVYTVSFTAAL